MKKAIVTGANGFVGNAVVKELCRQGVEVTALIHTVQKREFDRDKVKLIEFNLEDASNLSKIITDRDYDVFYHFAWNGGHGTDRNDTLTQLKNVQWSIDCLRVAKEIGCKRFIGVGTIMEFESYSASNEQENMPNMGYIYGGAKLTAHMMMKSVAVSLGIDLVWGMLINAYGPGEKSPRLINRTIRTVLGGEKLLEFTKGEQNYDFVFIDDAARAFYLLGEKGKAFKQYMIGSGDAKPLRVFLETIREELNAPQEFTYGAVPYTGINLPLETFSIDEIQADTGYEPKTSFIDGIIQTARWMNSQM